MFKKIALVTPYYYPLPGGVQEYVYHLKKEYKKTGYKVKVITGNFGGISHDEKDVIRLGRGFPFYVNGSTGRVIVFHGRDKVKETLEKEKFDIIHFQEPFVPFLSHRIIEFSTSLNVATFHANFNSNPFYGAAGAFLKPLWKKLPGKIAVSESAKRSINKYFHGPVEIIPNGVDVKRFSPRLPKIKKYADGKINILFAGRIEKRKGLIYLLNAYKKLHTHYPETRLIIIGKGPLLNKYRDWARKNRLKNIFFEGFVSHSILPRYFATSHIFCSPALFGESFGIVLLEAFASGLPVVAFDISGYNDVVSHRKNGLLARPKDVKSLYRNLAVLIKNPKLRKKLGDSGLKTARNFDWKIISRRNISYYKKLWKARS